MLSIFKKASSTNGQGTVEASFVLPILMTLILLLVQPGIYLYDLIVMRSAASETVRLLATSSGTTKNVEDFVRRRLSAIPQTDVFHIHGGGCKYEVETWESNEKTFGIRIKNELKPLPLIDAGLKVMGVLNSSGNLVVEVKEEMRQQPEWM